MINKKFLLISMLYATHCFAKDEVEMHQDDVITLEIAGLGTLDNTGLVNISKIAEFRDKIHKFIIHKIKMPSGEHFDLEELIAAIVNGSLSKELEAKLFNLYTKKFLQVSDPYFKDIRHLKPLLVKVLSIWAHQRNRTDSLVLLWAQIDNGKEEQFVKEYTPTLQAFYTFLVDIDMLLLDIMHSCPKTYAKYLECKKIVEEQHHK